MPIAQRSALLITALLPPILFHPLGHGLFPANKTGQETFLQSWMLSWRLKSRWRGTCEERLSVLVYR
jgi:hypothetical protein